MDSNKVVNNPKPVPVVYTCGDCYVDNEIRPSEKAIQCAKCRGKIMYKKRTTRVVVLDAR